MPKVVKATELMGAAEVAEYLGVKPTTVYNWHKRGLMMPPIANLSMGPVWIRSQIEALKKFPPTNPNHPPVKARRERAKRK
jgi:predicted DNA-binding transcriptional regulator AlpA